jgi:hypothetical protein
VVEFWLGQDALTGTIPSSIGQMTALTSLYLGVNKLAGTIPPAIVNLKKLTNLHLQSNRLTGDVPRLDFAELSHAADPSHDCVLNTFPSCKGPECNNFSCPLPPNSNKCGNIECAYEPCVGNSSSLAPAECNAWQDIFSATNGKGWSHFNDSRLDPCSCIPVYGVHGGVVCTSGSIVSMNLGNFGLTGTIPSSIGRLTAMTSFNLEHNRLLGTLPDSIGQMTAMTFYTSP